MGKKHTCNHTNYMYIERIRRIRRGCFLLTNMVTRVVPNLFFVIFAQLRSGIKVLHENLNCYEKMSLFYFCTEIDTLIISVSLRRRIEFLFDIRGGILLDRRIVFLEV